MDEAVKKAHDDAEAAGERCYRDPETDLWVCTASFLRERGRCCHSGCRHCPYEDGPG